MITWKMKVKYNTKVNKLDNLPNILLIVADSARADKFSCYGYHHNTTPNIDKFARSGVRFDSAITESPWTLPSHLSLFTGLYPSEHGKITGFDLSNLSLPNSIITLPEVLSKRGYTTGGFSSNPWIGRLTDINTKFDIYIEENLEITKGNIVVNAPWHLRMIKKTKIYSRIVSLFIGLGLPVPFMVDHGKLSRILLSNLMEWITSQDGPFFAFINLMNCHNPYYPPKENLRRFLDDDRIMGVYLFNKRLTQQFQGKIDLDHYLIINMHAYYDACLNYMDEQIGDLFSFLKDRGIFDDTLIILLSDHGKTLTEHDRQKYPLHYITDTNLHIPLIVRYPKLFKPSVEKRHVQLLHVTNTLLKVAGVENPNLLNERPSLMDIMKGSVPENAAYSEVVIPYSGKVGNNSDRVRCIKEGDFKLVESKKQGLILLNKNKDPNEEVDFSKDYPDTVREMKIRLDKKFSSFEWFYGKRKNGRVTLDEAIKRVREKIISGESIY